MKIRPVREPRNALLFDGWTGVSGKTIVLQLKLDRTELITNLFSMINYSLISIEVYIVYSVILRLQITKGFVLYEHNVLSCLNILVYLPWWSFQEKKKKVLTCYKTAAGVFSINSMWSKSFVDILYMHAQTRMIVTTTMVLNQENESNK